MTLAPNITFREYVQRVVGNPRRADELKVLVELFGMAYLEKILAGTVKVEAEDFWKPKKTSAA